ncbi:hypothetical protein E1J03_26055 [Phocaeicola dorei]|nr:hypothetical protein E1J03_26055 [Phocaeicola dorei]
MFGGFFFFWAFPWDGRALRSKSSPKGCGLYSAIPNAIWVSALSFCYRDLSAWWENRTDQPGTQYHFVIASRLFLWCNAPILLSF